MNLFFLKKLISAAIMPISIIILLLIVGLLLLNYSAKYGKRCIWSALALLLICSLSPVSDFLMRPLESHYSTYIATNERVDYIVILGCGHVSDNRLTTHDQLKVCSLQRMIEGYRIYQQHPNARIITSGYNGADPISNAEKVKDSLVNLGVPSSKIIMENFPKDTEEEAQLISPRVKGDRVVLVTNADHMRRSINYFQQQGVYPVAAPTGHWVKNYRGNKSWGYYVPNASAFKQTTIAWYEYLGLTVQWLKQLA